MHRKLMGLAFAALATGALALGAFTGLAQADEKKMTIGVSIPAADHGWTAGVVYHAEQDKVHYLNPSASMIFELCTETTTVAAITAYLQETYALAAPPTGEVHACLEELTAQGIIRPC